MQKPVLLYTLIVSTTLLLGCFDPAYALPPTQPATIGPDDRSSDFAERIRFGCWRVEGKLVCGNKDKRTDQPKEEQPKPAPVEETCPPGRVGKPPNCECPDGTYLAAFVGCVPVIPTAPPPSAPSAPSTPSSGGAEPYCINCGGPGCLQKAPECPTGGLTTCVPVPGKTYVKCCCP